MTIEEDDGPRSARDFRLMLRTAAYVLLGAVGLIGTIVALTMHEAAQDSRILTVEKWQAARDKEARSELWRGRERERPPLPTPKG